MIFLQYLRQNNFDGIDFDWLFPASRDGSKSEDKENYVILMKELREEFEKEANSTGRDQLLISMAVPTFEDILEKGFDIAELNK